MKNQNNQKTAFNLAVCINFWRKQKITACLDKGGSFNYALYLRYLEHLKK